MGMTRTLVRASVIGGLVVGGVVLVAGTGRASAIANQVHTKILSVIDDNIEDPVAMRSQLRELESKYPVRIAEVRSQLSQLREQASRIEREKQISDRVVDLAEADRKSLNAAIEKAESMLQESREPGARRRLVIRFQGKKVVLDEAYAKTHDLAQTASVYAAREADCLRDLEGLRRDAERLQELLAKLEAEHTRFREQLVQIDGQIDAIARKERIVDLMQERQKRIDELSRYQVATIDQLKARIDRRRAELESQLDSLERGEHRGEYERRAATEIDDAASEQRRTADPREGIGAADMVVVDTNNAKQEPPADPAATAAE